MPHQVSAITNPTWFITGASSGLGKEIALEALRRGHKVIAAARNAKKLAALGSEGAIPLTLDVSGPNESVVGAVKSAIQAHGPITHVINAAGYGLDATFEESTAEDVRKQFDTNVIGSVNVTRAFLPHLREQGRGVVALFGSVGSWRGFPGMSHYCATKWVASSLALSLSEELRCFGIDVVAIEPGYFRTGFLNPGNRNFGSAVIDAYEGTPGRTAHDNLNAYDNKQPGDPEKGARLVVDVLSHEGVGKGREIPTRLIMGSDTVADIRQHIRDTEKLLQDWEEIACSTDHDDTRAQ